MRGKVGSQFRRLSTALNSLVATGFTLTRCEEPSAEPVPLILVMGWQKGWT